MVRPITVIFLCDDQLLLGRAEFFQLPGWQSFFLEANPLLVSNVAHVFDNDPLLPVHKVPINSGHDHSLFQ